MKFYTKQLIKYCLCDDKYTMKDQMYAIENISFHLFFTFLRGVTFSTYGFQGALPQKRKYMYKLKYNPIIVTIKTEKVAQNLKRKINSAMRAWLLASL